jgi:hypothetical protein
MSIFAAIAEDENLAQQFKESAAKPAPRDFEGPDGDYTAVFTGQRSHLKNGNTMAFFGFRVEGGEWDNSTLSQLFYFKADGDVAKTMDRMIAFCRRLGAEDVSDLEQELGKIQGRTKFRIGIKTDEKGFQSVFVRGTAEEPTPGK